MGLVLRVEQYLGDNPNEYVDPAWEQLNDDVYHGGNAWEELAALLSLLLGIRLRAGGILRVFEPGDSGPGHPHEMDPPPYLPRPAMFPMLPGMSGYERDIDFSGLCLLDAYTRMSSRQARALVRSARSYQDAIWIADSDPRQAWLRLVTAVEAIAQLQPEVPAASRLQAIYPEIAERVARCGDEELADWVTAKFADQGRATARFLAFLKEFQPSPPPRRPRYSPQRQGWRTLQQQLKDIYAARSNDLHQGLPIPRAMCEAPCVSPSGIADEVTYFPPTRLRLHMFEYIVRSALQSWWRAIAETPALGGSNTTHRRRK